MFEWTEKIQRYEIRVEKNPPVSSWEKEPLGTSIDLIKEKRYRFLKRSRRVFRKERLSNLRDFSVGRKVEVNVQTVPKPRSTNFGLKTVNFLK